MAKSAGQAAREFTVEVIHTDQGAEQIFDDWHQLANKAGIGPFSFPDVALSWWRALGKGHLHIVTVRDGSGELVGLAPFYERPRGPVMSIGVLGTGVGAIGGLLTQPSKVNITAMLLEGALGEGRTVLDLQNFRYSEPSINHLRRNDQLETRIELQDECPIIDLVGYSDATDYLASSDRSGLRKKLAKADRSLTERAVEYRTSSADSIMEEWQLLQPLYDEAEKANPRQHFGQGDGATFFDSVLQSMALRDRAYITTLLIDGDPAAFDVWIQSGSVVNAVLGRFDPELADVSPGQLLLRYGVQVALDRDATAIDLQLGDDLYKRRWATGTYDTVHIRSSAKRNFTLADGVLKGVDAAFGLRKRIR